MLIYNPAFDLNHCIYRMLQLIENMKSNEVEIDRIRIWDYYLVFPYEIQKVELPSSAVSLRKYFKDDKNPYEKILNPRKVFYRMEQYQLNALKCIASYDFIDTESLNNGKIKPTKRALPTEISDKIKESSVRNQNLLSLLTGHFSNIPLKGKDGLKKRTNLMEYQYDTL